MALPMLLFTRRKVSSAGAPRFRALIGFVLVHVIVSGGVAVAFAGYFGHRKTTALAHLLLICQLDGVLLLLLGAVGAPLRRRAKCAPYLCAVVPAVIVSLQLYLYALDFFSNVFWGRNITAHLMAAYAPSVLSGRESLPFLPFGRMAILALTLVIFVATFGLLARWSRSILHGVGCAHGGMRQFGWIGARAERLGFVVASGVIAAMLIVTIRWGIESQRPVWANEMVVSFLRPNSIVFEPTARRIAVGDRDQLLRAGYPHQPAATKKNVIVIVVDSLRADHMQVYGYGRPTTPFLTSLVSDGRMRKVEVALSTCSESYCGIASVLSSKEFRDISPRNFKLHDVLHDLGWQTWFVLAGNHLSWYNLGQFYGDGAEMIFDGSKSKTYSIDDDRVVLEGLERVPNASGAPAFFYIHLMSTHYAGLQLAGYHTYARDQVDRTRSPHEIIPQLDTPDRYDDKVLQADDFIRQVFERLRRKHYLDDAIVVVTGDHGEGLGERHTGHGRYLYEEDVRVPLLIYDDPAVRYANLQFATQLDVAPTILDRLGLPVPASWEGRSLLAPDVPRYTFHQTSLPPLRYAVVYRSAAAIFEYLACASGCAEELYDLSRDPAEAHNLIANADPALVGDLRVRMAQYVTSGS